MTICHRPCRVCGTVLDSENNWTSTAQKFRQYICRLCDNARQRAYRRSEKGQVITRKYRDANRERQAQRMAEWGRKNPDKLKANYARYRENNYEHLQELWRQARARYLARQAEKKNNKPEGDQ